jgi:hypothetical protein
VSQKVAFGRLITHHTSHINLITFNMLANSLLVLASAALALASPTVSFGKGSSCKPGKPAPVLPVNGGRKS